MSVLLNFLVKGGPVTWIIAFLGVFCLFIIIERALHLHRAQINVPEFVRGLLNVLKRRNVLEAISICDETPGPVAHVARSALIRCERDSNAMLQAMHEANLEEIPRLEKNLKLLLTIGQLAPLLGLLGTVVGLIGVFRLIDPVGLIGPDIKLMAPYISQALLSTAAGLCVAVPAYGFFSYFHARIESILVDMEKVASEILYFLSEHDLRMENADAQIAAEDLAEGNGTRASQDV